MSNENGLDIQRIFEEGTLIDEALAIGVRDALRLHKLAGNPVAECRNGEVVWIAPEDINLDDEAWGLPSSSPSVGFGSSGI